MVEKDHLPLQVATALTRSALVALPKIQTEKSPDPEFALAVFLRVNWRKTKVPLDMFDIQNAMLREAKFNTHAETGTLKLLVRPMLCGTCASKELGSRKAVDAAVLLIQNLIDDSRTPKRVDEDTIKISIIKKILAFFGDNKRKL